MTEERFSHIVGRYFRKRNTHPATLMFKNRMVDDSFLVDLDKTIQNTFEPRDDIELITTQIVEGDYWSGVLIEFNQDEFDDVDSTDWDADTLVSTLMDIYREFDTGNNQITGLSTGSSVYAVASLETLGKDYFKTASDVYHGPTID